MIITHQPSLALYPFASFASAVCALLSSQILLCM